MPFNLLGGALNLLSRLTIPDWLRRLITPKQQATVPQTTQTTPQVKTQVLEEKKETPKVSAPVVSTKQAVISEQPQQLERERISPVFPPISEEKKASDVIDLNKFQETLSQQLSQVKDYEDISTIRGMFQTVLEGFKKQQEEMGSLLGAMKPPSIGDIVNTINEVRKAINLDEVEQRYLEVYNKIVSIPQQVEQEFSFEKTGLVYPTAFIAQEVERRIKPLKPVLDVLSAELGRKEALFDLIMKEYNVSRTEAKDYLQMYLTYSKSNFQNLINVFDKLFDDYKDLAKLRQAEMKEVIDLAIKAPGANIVPGVDNLTSATIKALPYLQAKEIINQQLKLFNLQLKEAQLGLQMERLRLAEERLALTREKETALLHPSSRTISDLLETYGRVGYQAFMDKLKDLVGTGGARRVQFYEAFLEELNRTVKNNPRKVLEWAQARAYLKNPQKPEERIKEEIDAIIQEISPNLQPDTYNSLMEFYKREVVVPEQEARKKIEGFFPWLWRKIKGVFGKKVSFIEGKQYDFLHNLFASQRFLTFEPTELPFLGEVPTISIKT